MQLFGVAGCCNPVARHLQFSCHRAWVNRSKSIRTGALSQFVLLRRALALKGPPQKPPRSVAAARRLSPNFTIAKFRAEAVSDNPVYLAQRERLHEGLRLAGVPES